MDQNLEFPDIFYLFWESSRKFWIRMQKLNVKKNVSYKGIVTRKKSLQLISVSKYSLGSFENLFSFFVLDCLSNNLKIFFNKNFKIDKKLIKTNLLIPIDFYNLKKSLKSINNSIKSKNLNTLKFKKLNFSSFFSQ